MITALTIIALALVWLLIETDYMRVRLPVGKELPRYGVGRTMAQWEVYNKAHAKELEKERKEYTERQAIIKAHTCPICRAYNEDFLIETKTIIAGNSTCHITGCPDCLAKYEKEIIKSQESNPRQPTYKQSTTEPRGFIPDYGDIEILVDGKLELSLNGDNKRGMVKDFMGEYTHKVRAGKKTMTVQNGDEVINCGGGVYVAKPKGEVANFLS